MGAIEEKKANQLRRSTNILCTLYMHRSVNLIVLVITTYSAFGKCKAVGMIVPLSKNDLMYNRDLH